MKWLVAVAAQEGSAHPCNRLERQWCSASSLVGEPSRSQVQTPEFDTNLPETTMIPVRDT